MKHILHISLLAMTGLMISCGGTDDPVSAAAEIRPAIKIRIKGSETIRPVIEKIDNDYMTIHPNVFVDYTGGGSNVGLMSFLSDEAELAFVSKTLSTEESDQLKEKGALIDSFAIDGVAVIVNLNNPVESLSLEQVRNLYAGKVTNWKDVGGKDWPVVLYSRDISSGTYSFFKDKVLDSLNYSPDDINLTHNEEINNNVAKSKNAIGYVGLSYANHPNIKPVPLIFNPAEKPMAPTFQNIGSNSYPLKRYILLIHHQHEPDAIRDFIRVLKSEQGLKAINECGLFPVRKL